MTYPSVPPIWMPQPKFNLTLFVLIIFIVGLALSFESQASSCMLMTKEMIDKQSHKYKDQVRINVTKQNEKYLVEAFFPPHIVGGYLSEVMFFKGMPKYGTDRMDQDFSMSLKVKEQDDGRMYSSYSVKAEYARDNYIRASYGGACSGVALQYHIEFEDDVEN